MFDFTRFAREHQVPTVDSGNEHCRYGWLQAPCPFCGDAPGDFHLGFNLEGGAFHCWRCGSHSVWDTVAKYLKTENKSVLYKTIKEQYETGRRSTIKRKTWKPSRVQSTERNHDLPPPPGTGELSPIHRRYLKKRGFQPALIKRLWGVRGTTYLGGIWAWRIIIPLHVKGQVVAYQGRTVKDAQPKYRMTEDNKCLVNPKSILYGLDKVEGDGVVVVEGATGVWRLGPGAVGTLGIDWSLARANILRRFKRRYILFDPEPLAQKRATQLANWLSAYNGTTEVLSGFRTDPGDFSDVQARRVMLTLNVGGG